MNLVRGRVYTATFLVPTPRGHAFVPNVRAKFVAESCDLLVFETERPVVHFGNQESPCVVVVDRSSVVV
jgi:hypothetical protein